MLIISSSLLACSNFWWQLKLETLTQGKGLDLTRFSNLYLFFNWFSHPILTHLRMHNSIFSQGITHDDTLKESDWDAQMIPRWCLKGYHLILAQHWWEGTYEGAIWLCDVDWCKNHGAQDVGRRWGHISTWVCHIKSSQIKMEKVDKKRCSLQLPMH